MIPFILRLLKFMATAVVGNCYNIESDEVFNTLVHKHIMYLNREI